MLTTLEQVRADIDRRLAQAAADWRCAMHTPVVATADADARVMVLRDWDAPSRTLRFHTDSRAPKSALIGTGAPVGVLFYDKDAKVQIRCRGTGRIEGLGKEVDDAWAASTSFARRCYLGAAPGAVSAVPTSGLPPEVEGVEPDDAQLVPARANFALLLVAVKRIDWFCLAHTGHRRAILDTEGERWVAP